MSDEKIIIITQGEKAVFDIYLEKEYGFPRPVDLTNFDEFKCCIETESGVLELTEVANANGSIIEKIAPDVLGHLRVTIFPLDTTNLKAGYSQNIDIQWDNSLSPGPKRKRLYKALNVESSLC